MVRFSNQEYFDILGVFHRENGNATLAERIYQELYPDRRQPSRHVFGRVHGNFIATGSVFSTTNDKNAPAVEEFEDAVLNAVEESPSTSTRAMAKDLNTSHSTVWRILKKFGYRPFKISFHHELLNTDYERRLNFCNWILSQPDIFFLVMRARSAVMGQ